MSRPRRYMFEREGWELSVVCVNLVQKLLTVSGHTDLFLVLSTLGTIFLILGEDTNKEHYLKHTKGVRSLMFLVQQLPLLLSRAYLRKRRKLHQIYLCNVKDLSSFIRYYLVCDCFFFYYSSAYISVSRHNYCTGRNWTLFFS